MVRKAEGIAYPSNPNGVYDRMKKFLLATTLLALSAVATNAADLPRKSAPVYKPVVAVPAFSWTGFYVGINGGWVRNQISQRGNGKASSNGGLVGGTIGYNYQLQNNVVLGVEGDLGFASNSYKGRSVVFAGDALKFTTNYLGTVRGRLGYSFGSFMPYVTGGVAFGGTKERYVLFPNTFSKNQTSIGWTVGAGVEAQVWQNVTAKVEYLYADLGSSNYQTIGKIGSKNHIVRAGLNYKF
jgi:outer membrane immunogenic protein